MSVAALGSQPMNAFISEDNAAHDINRQTRPYSYAFFV
jgi:hypothetical protein